MEERRGWRRKELEEQMNAHKLKLKQQASSEQANKLREIQEAQAVLDSLQHQQAQLQKQVDEAAAAASGVQDESALPADYDYVTSPWNLNNLPYLSLS